MHRSVLYQHAEWIRQDGPPVLVADRQVTSYNILPPAECAPAHLEVGGHHFVVIVVYKNGTRLILSPGFFYDPIITQQPILHWPRPLVGWFIHPMVR